MAARVCCFAIVILAAAQIRADRPATRDSGLDVGQRLPFQVVDFLGVKGSGCPAVMIANRRTRGVIVWTQTANDDLVRLAKALDEKAVDGGRLHGFVVGFGEASDNLKPRAAEFRHVVLAKPRRADSNLGMFGVPTQVHTKVFLLDGNAISATWAFATDELTAKRIDEVIAKATQFAADSFPVLVRLASRDDVSIPLSFADAKSPGRVIRSAAELDAAWSRPDAKEEDRARLVKQLGREIDWQREMLLAVSGGETPRGFRYWPSIQPPKRQEDFLVVPYVVLKTKTVIVGSDGGIGVALVPRFDGEVRFEKRNEE